VWDSILVESEIDCNDHILQEISIGSVYSRADLPPKIVSDYCTTLSLFLIWHTKSVNRMAAGSGQVIEFFSPSPTFQTHLT